MPRTTLARTLFYGYLTLFGVLCIVAAVVEPRRLLAAIVLGVVLIPFGVWRLWRGLPRLKHEWGASRDEKVEKATKAARIDAASEPFRTIVEGSCVGLFLMDLDGRLTQTNPALQEMLGYPDKELLGKKPAEFTLRSDVPVDAELFRELVKGTRDRYQVEKRYIRQNTETLWAYLSMSLIRDEDGQPCSLVGLVQDITEDKQVGSTLRDIEQLFRLTFDQAAVGIAHTDREGRFMFINRRLCEMLGYRREEMFGRELRAVTYAADAEESARAMQQLLAGEVPEYSGEARYVRKDGTFLWAHLTMSLVRQPTGEPKYGIVMIEDITERRQTQEALRVSEEQYRVIAETASDAIVTMDENSRILFVNEATTTIFGYTEDELVGAPLSVLLPRTAEYDPAYLRDRWNGGSSRLELPGVHKNGQALCLEVAFAESPHQNERMFTGIIRDITDRKAEEQERTELIKREQEVRAMTEAAAMVRGVVQASPLPILTLEPQGRILSWNTAATEAFGWTENEAYGHPIPFVVEAGTGDLDEFRERALRGESVTNREIRVRTRDGSLLDLYMSTAPVRDGHGEIGGVMYVYADITARKRAEEKLAGARDQALEASRLKSEFLATMSHEIRTPMNAIIGMTELLLDTPLDNEQNEFVNVVANSAQALLTIINDILDFSRIEADKLVLDSVDFEPVTIVEGAAELLATKAREKGLSVMTYVDPAVPAWLRGDAGRLRQVLLNLISNAVKFTDRGDITIEATLVAENESGATLRFAVSDTGIGLSEEARKRLFQPFVQADGSTTRKYGGTGLGLAICKRLVELMDGAIGVDSVEGRGATFWFTTCFVPASGTVRPPLPRGSLSGLRALAVGGSQPSRDILRRTLESRGMKVEAVTSASQALGALLQAPASTPYSVVITEMALPDMDGLELGRSIKGNENLSHVPVIMLTGVERRGQGEAAVGTGFAAYLTKPAKQDQLLDAIRTAVSQRRATPLTEERAEEPVATPEVPAPPTPTVRPGPQLSVEPEPALRRSTSPFVPATPEPDPIPWTPEPAPAAPMPEPTPVASSPEPPPPAPVQPQPAVQKTGALILLVEDNVNNQIMTMRQLEKLGHGVHVVSNGLQAVKALAMKSSRYDLVFMDCQMPEMDGYSATREVRKLEVTSGRHIPIVAMTANAMSGDREACISAGMDDYIPKPVTRQVIVEALEQWLPEVGSHVAAVVA